MRTLYHLWLSPFSRKIRIALAEKKLDFELKAENPAERRAAFLALNPACDVPVLVEDSGPVISNSAAIGEYLEEICPDPPLCRSHDERMVGGGQARDPRRGVERALIEGLN